MIYSDKDLLRSAKRALADVLRFSYRRGKLIHTVPEFTLIQVQEILRKIKEQEVRKMSDPEKSEISLKEIMYNSSIEALTLFAVWREGEQWVNDMRTLKEAKRIIYKRIYGKDQDDTRADD